MWIRLFSSGESVPTTNLRKSSSSCAVFQSPYHNCCHYSGLTPKLPCSHATISADSLTCSTRFQVFFPLVCLEDYFLLFSFFFFFPIDLFPSTFSICFTYLLFRSQHWTSTDSYPKAPFFESSSKQLPTLINRPPVSHLFPVIWPGEAGE